MLLPSAVYLGCARWSLTAGVAYDMIFKKGPWWDLRVKIMGGLIIGVGMMYRLDHW